GGLAGPVAQEVQRGSPDLAVTDDLDLLDAGAVDLEGPLDADTARDPADRDRARDPAAAEAHHDALEDVDPRAVAFHDLGRDLDRVARGELGKVGAELVGDDLVEDVHRAFVPYCVGRQREAAGRVEGTTERIGRRRSIAWRPRAPGQRRGGDGVRWRLGCASRAPRSPVQSASVSSRSGRRFAVRARACSSRQRATAPWSPDVRIAGTSCPRNDGGRVYCGYSRR